MYLENSEQAKVSEEGELSTEAMLAEQCQVPKLTEVTDLTSPSKEHSEHGIKVLVEYSKQTDSSLLCVEHCNMNRDETEFLTYCNGHVECLEQYSASNGLFEYDETLDHCETLRLNQSFDEYAKHCKCLKLWTSSEHCANHSLASKCSECCEHYAEHLRLFKQCKASGQEFESFDFETGDLAVNSDSVGQCEMSDFIPESTDHLELQYEPSLQQCEGFDSEPDTSTEDAEQYEMTGFTADISDSVDLLDCGIELCEYDEFQAHIDDGNEENYPPEQNTTETSDDESCRLSEEANCSCFDTAVYFDDSEQACFATEYCEKYLEECSQQATALDMSTNVCNMCGNDDSETNHEHEQTEQCATSDKTCANSEFCTEEDGFSDCSSMESKSFKTCPDGSIPSDPCSDSSEESEKGAQEDSSDEQTLWESFEDDKEIEQSNTNKSNEDEKKTPTVDIVIEDYFDLFDRSDYYGHVVSQKRHYISCFDGGDIHDSLFLEEEAQKLNVKNACTFKEIDIQEDDVCFDPPEDACEETSEEDISHGGDCEVNSESSLAEDENKETECGAYALYAEKYKPRKEDDNMFDRAACASEGHVSEIFNEQVADVCLPSGNEESICAPCAKDISVEGDAYEDDVYDFQNNESLGDNIFSIDREDTSVTDCKKDSDPEAEDNIFTECSEMEPYMSIINNVDNGETCAPDVEEYYAFQIKSVQSSGEKALKEFVMLRKSYDQIIHGKAHVVSSINETEEEALLSQKESELQTPGVCQEECKAVILGITEIIELCKNIANCSVIEKTTSEQTLGSDGDCGFNGFSRETQPPLDVIHSVVSEHVKFEEGDAEMQENSLSEESRDSEEEQSDDESSEPCECEYCIPLTEQVPAEPLLPQMKSNDAGKICVVIDLDETLVHSSFKPVNNADFIIPVEIDGTVHQVYVLKRPHVDEFLKRMGELFECVLFTASLAKYADPVSDLLDKWGAFQCRLFRESCVFHKGNYVKDLSRLGRDLKKVIIIDNSPASYIFHPDNAVPVASWFDDMSDTELLDLIPFFERLSKVDDIYDMLNHQRTSS
ncbi:uncharacterized protein LOC113123874 isoform X1 [Mastacembelus armatus]|uniref:uncharacterized protein LOC113123874 isoform X1 n=1 Tax=Mastacembelus armatus TaxID=205130 RepID=UPI000E45D8E8|nr:uncharacterized protein LOC113123874 isoform X1 [Mastacembelus armatus]